MADRQCPEPTDDAPSKPRPRRFETVADMWLSDDPPWDREVLENIDELSWCLGDLPQWDDRHEEAAARRPDRPRRQVRDQPG